MAALMRHQFAVGDSAVVRTTRRCSKVLLVDEHEHVLLVSGIDRTRPDMRPWWFAVGGELDPDESAEDAAIRETFEETGLRISDPGPVVFTREFSWEFEGEDYDQTEWFFLVRTTRFEPNSSRWTAMESATMRGHRWWSLAELRDTDETVFPENLASTLESLLAR
jgi:8-oxo-dGTP pyrophosphatase MutT (NUDIX family)